MKFLRVVRTILVLIFLWAAAIAALFCFTLPILEAGGVLAPVAAEGVNPAKAYFNRGTACYEKGDFKAAVKYLSRAISLEPNAPDAYFNRGLSFRQQHKIDEAISDFSKAIELYPDHPAYYFSRCNALIVKNDFDRAVTDCSEAIRLSPGEPEPYFLRGLAFMLKGDLDRSLADSIRSLQIYPDYADARRLLGETLLKIEMTRRTSDFKRKLE